VDAAPPTIPSVGTKAGKLKASMRFPKGMRRIALALGAFGLLGCCYVAVIGPCDQISSNLRRQREFDSAMRIPWVQAVLGRFSKHGAKDAALYTFRTPLARTESTRSKTMGSPAVPSAPAIPLFSDFVQPNQQRVWDSSNDVQVQLAAGTTLHFPAGVDPAVVQQTVERDFGQQQVQQPPEISLIQVGSDGKVLSFEKNDGTTIYKPEANTPWMYLSLVLLPISGFFIPWGAARGFTWIVSGFLDSGPCSTDGQSPSDPSTESSSHDTVQDKQRMA